MLMRFHHIGLVVPDLDSARRFYARALRFHDLFEGGWVAPSPLFEGITGLSGTSARTAMMEGPCGLLELFEYSAPVSEAEPSARTAADRGLRHIGIETDTPEAVVEAILEAGGRRDGVLTQVPGGARAIYCRDPFGNIIEILKAGGRIPSRLPDAH
ncbi:VOC family protein [Mameliella alba]|nr:VOC family protein [Mameliella alba]MBY6169623.1 VOC family protein [Mameliella alba]MBY6174642.1 VOC family protein [Mameliella alba]